MQLWLACLVLCLFACRSNEKEEKEEETPPVQKVEVKPKPGPKQETPPTTTPEPTKPTPPTSQGCGKSQTFKGAFDKEIEAAKVKRKYLLVPPYNYDPNKPYGVVFWYHGAGSSPETTRGVPNYNHSPNLEKLAGDNTFFIHPRNISGTSITWDHGVPGRDISLFDAIHADLLKSYCINPDKVFIIGVSNGGLFVNVLASARPEQVKGVVAVALPGLGGNWRKVAMRNMLVQDDRDQFASAQSSARKMASDQGCKVENGDLSPKSPNQCLEFKDCSVPVAFCPWKVLPGWNPHDWPRFANADEQIWKFLNP